MNEKTLQKLEYQTVLNRAAQFAVSPTAKQKLLAAKPSGDIDEIAFLLGLTDEALQYVNHSVIPEFGFDDITDAAQKARVVSTLSMKELLRVMRLLRLSRISKATLINFSALPECSIKELAAAIYVDRTLEELIDVSIVSEEEMSDKASEKLASIRREIKKVNAEIRAKLASYTKSKELAPYLQDAIVTMRGGRYVIPVKQEYKGAVNGLVHDQSASGSTLFIEPMAIVNLNNQLKTLSADEKEEIERILQEFTKSVSQIAQRLVTNQEIISDLDVAFAKARYAIDIRAAKPAVNQKGFCDIKKGRHPLLSRDTVVPVSVYLGKDFNIVVVTGPNTGGKTVTLKTIGLFCLMAYTGMYLPASEGTEVALFEEIFCDIGDEQSIEQSLSTFSSHIKNISAVLSKVNSDTLVLLDELCAGTEPNEGAALALAVTEFLRQSGARAVLTTHYSLLKEYSLVTEGVENASMEFNPDTFEPTYRLIMGVPGSSNAIEIATRLGLDKRVIEIARGRLTGEKISFENVLQNAERIRHEFLGKKEEVESEKRLIQEELAKAKEQNKILQEEREKLLRNSKIQAKQIISDAQAQSKEILDRLKEIVDRAGLDEKSLFEGRALAKKLKEKTYSDDATEPQDIFTGDKVDPSTLEKGDSVYVPKLNSVASVIAVEKGGKARIKCGSITTVVTLDELYRFVDTRPKEKKISSVSTPLRKLAARTEINLLGMTVGEAVVETDKFIDEAILNGLSEIKIVHGVGTGKLRQGLHDHFRNHPNVAEFRLGVYGEGEAGVTILKLK